MAAFADWGMRNSKARHPGDVVGWSSSTCISSMTNRFWRYPCGDGIHTWAGVQSTYEVFRVNPRTTFGKPSKKVLAKCCLCWQSVAQLPQRQSRIWHLIKKIRETGRHLKRNTVFAVPLRTYAMWAIWRLRFMVRLVSLVQILEESRIHFAWLSWITHDCKRKLNTRRCLQIGIRYLRLT